MIKLISLCVLVFASAAGLTKLMGGLARTRGLLDVPNSRSSHSRVVPRGGGLAIIIVFVSALTLLWLYGSIQTPLYAGLCVAGMMVGGIGFRDDFRHVPQQWRVLVHVIAVLLSLYIIGNEFIEVTSFDGGYNQWVIIPLVVLLLVWWLNLFNFMDGIDGIAGSETLFIALSGAWITYYSGQSEISLVFLMLAERKSVV